MSPRPYAGQSWRAGLMQGPLALAGLEIVARDLRVDAQQQGITGQEIELWRQDETGSQGFFVGDTAVLATQGWTKLATL